MSADASAEAVAEIKKALSILKAPAAEEFVRYYLYEELPEEFPDLIPEMVSEIVSDASAGSEMTSSIMDQSPRFEASLVGFAANESYRHL
jgi:hypothetical protein